MKRFVCLAVLFALVVSGCVVFAPPGQAKKAAGVKPVDVKVKVKSD